MTTWGAGTWGSGPWGGGTPNVPDERIFVAFDRDPLAPLGLISGDDATCDGLGNWAAGPNTTLTLNMATSRVHAGKACLKLIAIADGDISVTLPVTGATAGRIHALWCHARGEGASRSFAASLAWKSATGVALTTDVSGTLTDSRRRFTRLGLLATAPPAATQATLTITITGALAGEVHYVDAVAMDDVGTDVSEFVDSWTARGGGRNHELDRTDNGTASVVLENVDGRFTPGRAVTSLAPYASNIVPRRRVWILALWAGVLQPVWSGYVRKWVETERVLDGWAKVTATCDDGFRMLTGADVLAPYRAEVLSDGPLSLFPLDEPASSDFAVDIVAGAPARLLVAASGAGASAFGAATVLPVQPTGRNTDGGSTSLALNVAQDLGTAGAVLDLRFAGGMPPQLVFAPWTLECWFDYQGQVSPPPIAQALFQHVKPFGTTDALSGFNISIETDGTVLVTTAGGEQVGRTGGDLTGSGPGHRSHHIALTYESGGGAFGTASFYLDGDLIGSAALANDPFPFGLPTVAKLGGALNTTTKQPSFLFTGRVSHVAFYYQRLSAGRIAAHVAAGRSGFVLETEADRCAAILAFAGWPAADTEADAGLTPLLARDWTASSGLALLQDTAGYGAGAVVMDARGAVRILSRHRQVNDVAFAAYFAASSITEPEADQFSPWDDDSRLENVVTVSRVGGGSVTVSDQVSVDRYGEAVGQPITIPAASDAEALARAQWRLSRTAGTPPRVNAVTFRPDSSPALWPVLLPLAFGDRVLLGELPDPEYSGRLADPVSACVTPLVTGAGSEIDATVGRIQHAAAAGTWTTTLTLEPALVDQCGICDDPTYGIADTPQCVAGY